MRPLLFLSLSQLRNSVKRSLTSAKRLISLVVFIAYMYLVALRPFTQRNPAIPHSPLHLVFPPVDILVAASFALGLAVTLILFASVGVQRSGFRSADVDVLFPTPVDPRAVLVLRMVRENLVGLIFPLVFALIGGSTVGAQLRGIFTQTGVPRGAESTYTWLILGYVSVQAFWVAAGYAFTLWAYQDGRPKWCGRLANWGFVAALTAIAIALGLIVRSPDLSAKLFLDAGLSGPLRALFPTATALSVIGTAALTGNYAGAGVCLVGLWGGTLLMMWLASKNVSWMYEQTALSVSAVESTRSAMRAGDMMAAFTQRAREGKLKKRRLPFIERLRWHGPLAVVWRDMIISLRTSLTSFLFFLVFGLVYTAVPALLGGREEGILTQAGLFVAPFITWTTVFAYNRTGFLDLLRRVDVDKALPFSLVQLLIAHSALRNFLACLLGWTMLIVPVVVSSSNFHAAASVAIALPAFAFLISGCVLLFMLIFPDMEDPSQRMLRELLTMALMVLALTPGIVAGALVLLVAESAFFAAALAASVTFVVVGALLFLACGELYAVHNPNE